MFPQLRIFNCLLLSCLLLPLLLHAQSPAGKANLRQPRILLLVDGSSSMLQPWQAGIAGPDRFRTAARIISALADSIYAINPQVELALRVYGHQSPAQNNDCYDSRREVGFSKDNRTQLALRMASLQPLGVSPIAWSLKEAAENDLTDENQNAYSIILITDGGESCGGDICAVARMLLEKKIFFRPYVLGLAEAPALKAQYDCLGRYLTASNEAGLTASVRTIVDDYRPLLRLPVMASSLPRTAVTPPAAPAPRTIAPPVITAAPRPALALLSPVPLPELPGARRPSVLRRDVQLEREPLSAAARPTRTPPPVAAAPAPRPVPPPATPPAQQPRPAAATPKPAPARPAPRPAPTAQRPSPKPAAPAQPAASEPAFTVQRKDDKETTFGVYFTDGHGTYYHTSPELQLTDTKTGETLKFRRSLDAYDEPRFQSIAPGTYTLTIPGRSSAQTRLRTVVIEANKKNRIEVVVNNGTIRFAYETNPDRPVNEFDAEIKISVGRGPVISQHCNTELPFPPETYHVEINTLPITRYVTDVDFNSVTVIMIPEPGFLEIANAEPVGKASLYVMKGAQDQWIRFHQFDVNGNVAEQIVRLKPGSYQLRHYRRSGIPGEEVVVPFFVESNKKTTLRL